MTTTITTTKTTILCVTIFSIAMGFLESAVVIYLRALFYPEGFDFPLNPISHEIAIVEIGREAATIVMLLGIGFLAGKSAVQRFAYFIFSFAVWDIFYYVFLYIFLGWPQSLLTWDILFLIPITWVGPVITPLLITVLMIWLALAIIRHNKAINTREWALLITGSVIVIVSWVWDYIRFLNQLELSQSFWKTMSTPEMKTLISNYTPVSFPWWLFALGYLVIVGGVVVYNKRREK